MKYISLSILTAATFSLTAQNTAYKVDPDKATITWHAEKVTGSHDGTVKLESGTIMMNGSTMVSGKFEVNMQSIAVTDIQDPEYNQKLTGHLKSEDFFAVEQHPKATLEFTKAIHQGKDRYKVEGKLTIKGISKSTKFTAFVTEENGVLKGTAEITIDRSEYNVKYGSGSFFDDLGDKTIYDEFTLKISLIANK